MSSESSSDAIFATSRVFPFAPEVIFAAFQEPTSLARWWGPNGFTNTFEVFDFTPGGRWRFVMHGPDGKNYRNESEFVAIEPHTRLVIRHDCQPFFTLTVTLTPDEGGTRLTWEQVFDDIDVARAVRRVVGSANEENLDRLHAVVKAQGVD